MHTYAHSLDVTPAPEGARRPARRAGRLAVAAALLAIVAGTGCTKVQKDDSSSYLIVNSLLGSSGAQSGGFGNVLSSDVLTCVSSTGAPAGYCRANYTPTIFADLGRVSFTLGLKDPGTSTSPTKPTSANFITISRYRVDWSRTDGGTAVPAAFESAISFTVNATGGEATFTLVPILAKTQAPIVGLVGGGGGIEIKTIATVTFFGKDQAGRDVQVVATIGVNFADWADPV
jgi:hypothetical protein